MVRRIQNMLTTDPKGFILKEKLVKQGDAVNKKTSDRLVTLDANKLQWFHDDTELQSGDFLGSIELRFIYNVIKSYQDHNERPAFMLGVTMWNKGIDRGAKRVVKEKGKREFFFSCEDILTRDKWMIAIEFLKTKAIYDKYSKNNSNVNFALHTRVEEETKQEEDRIDKNSLIYDFGPSLKNETRIVQKSNTIASNMGNMAQALATMQKAESFSKNPRMSVLRHTASV